MLLACNAIGVNQARVDSGGVTPLCIACYEGRTEVVAMFLAHDGIECEPSRSLAQDSRHHRRSNVLSVRLLLNASDSIAGGNGAQSTGQQKCEDTSKRNIVRRATTDDGSTPLNIACELGHTVIVTMLLARDGIDVNQARTDGGLTPLHSTILKGDLATAQLLVLRCKLGCC